MAAHTEALGPAREIDLDGTRIRYHQTGQGAPIVFVHGVFANSALWRLVVPDLAAAGHRCLTPDWPLGGHSIPVPAADLTPPGLADLIAAFLTALDLRDVTIVGNDTGGALVQILMARHPERIGRVVLTPSDCYDQFFPTFLKALPWLARIPGSTRMITESLRFPALRRLPITFGWLTREPLPRDVADAYLRPSRDSRAIRRDLGRFLRGVHRRHTLAAARSFPGFDRPVLLAWAAEDRFFPLRLARRLAADLPNATLRTIEGSYTFVPEEQPHRLAELILEFTDQHAPS